MSEKPNVLFVNMPSVPLEEILKGHASEGAISMPMGILHLSSYLRMKDMAEKIGIIDFAAEIFKYDPATNFDDFILDRSRKRASFAPDVLAVSFSFSSADSFFQKLVYSLKVLWPDAALIVGGNHATNSVQRLLSQPGVDYVGRGEGEFAFADFVEQIGKGGEVKVKGIFGKTDQDNTSLELCETPQDLDALPFPDWDLLDMDFYLTTHAARKRNIGEATEKRAAGVLTTRGCPYSCTFCASHTVHGRKMRYRSVESVVAEIKELHSRFGVNMLVPEDDLFTVKKTRVIELVNAISDLQLPDFEFQFPNALSVNTLDEEVLDALIAAGMKICTLAIESGSEFVQVNIIKKRCNLEKAKRLIKYLREKDIIVRCYFILGFPGETQEMMLESIEYARGLDADWCSFPVVIPLLGSEMYDQFLERGEYGVDDQVWASVYANRQFDTQEILAEEINELAYRTSLDLNFINNPNRRLGNFKRAIEIFQDILFRYPHHIVACYCIMECYEAQGADEEAADMRERTVTLIQTNRHSREMFEKYGDVMPRFLNSDLPGVMDKMALSFDGAVTSETNPVEFANRSHMSS